MESKVGIVVEFGEVVSDERNILGYRKVTPAPLPDPDGGPEERPRRRRGRAGRTVPPARSRTTRP